MVLERDIRREIEREREKKDWNSHENGTKLNVIYKKVNIEWCVIIKALETIITNAWKTITSISVIRKHGKPSGMGNVSLNSD